MKRKTNLFYTSGPDSKFITFSNYTEALTGNYLSVNTKLFPDNFLCLNIKNLNSNTKEIFIKYLVAYYENKLAALRDHNININTNIENNIYPLAYLLEAILKVVSYDGEEYSLNINNGELVINDDNLSSTEISNLITYIGQISETDYYGTYTDIICNINCEDYVEGKIIINNEDVSIDNLTYTLNENQNTLYGWENDYIISDYENVNPIYDKETTYLFNSRLSKLIFNKNDINSQLNKTLKFNVIIPLFSYVKIDENSKDAFKENIKEDDETKKHYILLNNGNKHSIDVPLGMWIYADNNNDTFIELIKDPNMNVYPNWSLLISTQFKPFPYSTKITKENATSNNIKSDSIGNSFSTFAEVLSKMNMVLDKFNTYNDQIIQLNNQITNINNQLKNIGTLANIEKINETVIQIESSVNSQIKDFKNQLNSYLQNIKWSEHIVSNN